MPGFFYCTQQTIIMSPAICSARAVNDSDAALLLSSCFAPPPPLIAYSTYLALFTSTRPIFTPAPGGHIQILRVSRVNQLSCARLTPRTRRPTQSGASSGCSVHECGRTQPERSSFGAVLTGGICLPQMVHEEGFTPEYWGGQRSGGSYRRGCSR